jgi:hypothetical protein
VGATHGRLYNIVTEQNRFPDLVREIGHSIATEYSLTYLTPRPIEDGTNRSVQLRVNYNGETGAAETSYQVKGVGGAAINEPAVGGTPGEVTPRSAQFAFAWWNGIVPLAAILGLIALSRMRFGVSSDELKAIVEAQSKAPSPNLAAAARQVAERARAAAPARSEPPAPASPRTMAPVTISGAGAPHEARLTTLDKIDSIPNEYALLKPEVAVGRGENNDIVIPHASVSRNHARLARRDGGFELIDLNSTNGSYINDQLVQGSMPVANGAEVRFGDIRFTLRF